MAVDYDRLAAAMFPIGLVTNGPIPLKVSVVTTLLDLRFISVREVTFLRVDNDEVYMKRAVLIMPNDGLILPMFADGTIGMVKMFRPGVAQVAWEFPQVRMDDGESSRDAAVRCAQQEVGLVGEPTHVDECLSFPTMPDRVTEVVYPSVIKGDFDFTRRTDNAIHEFARFTPGKIRTMILNREVVCPVCITAFAMYLWGMEDAFNSAR